MKSGYKIFWSHNALTELEETIDYLRRNFTEKEISRLAQKIEHTVQLISANPKLFPETEIINIRAVVILKYNTMYYRTRGNVVEIVSFFSNRRNPDTRDF